MNPVKRPRLWELGRAWNVANPEIANSHPYTQKRRPEAALRLLTKYQDRLSFSTGA